MTLKELILKEQELMAKAQEIIAGYLPLLEPIDQERDAIKKQILSIASEQAKAKYKEAKKDTGSINFSHQGVTVKVQTDKTVKWDQEFLAGMVKKIADNGDDPKDYIDAATVYNIPEARYNSMPQWAKEAFLKGRTVKAGKPKFEYIITEEELTQAPLLDDDIPF